MQIPEIKSRLPILTVVQHYDHKPNRNNLIKCPFHEDDKPSLQLYPTTNTWHCFGCNKGSDQIDFIKLKENCTMHQAINKAIELIPQIKTQITNLMNPAPTKQFTQEQRIHALTTAFTYFARSIASTDNAKQYLQSRSLDPQKITVGYDGHNFHKSKETTADLKKRYIAIGLIYPDKLGRKDSYHSFFDGCIVFPIYNEKGEIVNLYGRSIDDSSTQLTVKSKASKHHYLPGKHQGLYPKYPKPEAEILLLTECIIDAATLIQIPEIKSKCEIISCYGTNNFTEEHRAAIKNLQQLKEVIFFFDGDKAGREAVETHSKIIKEIKPNIKVSYIETPEGEDINSLIQGHESAVYTELLSNRKFFLSSEPEIKTNGSTSLTANGEDKTETIKNANQITTEPSQSKDIITGKLNTDNPEQLIYETEQTTITLWGGIEHYNIKKLRATIHIQSRQNEYLEYRDTVDLYSNSQTERLIREAGERLETGTSTMSKTITGLTKALEQYRQKEREKQRQSEEAAKKKNQESFTTQEMQQGERLLKDKNLMEKTEEHIKNIGLVGEEEKGMLLFFILLTRMFKEPLHALVQGKSGSGKTYLLKKIAGLLPKAHIRIATALTENTLYHSMKGFWTHVVLLIEDLDGVISALLALREMMSNQSISKFSTEKDLKTGEFKQMMLYVEGPICVAGATTKDKFYEDNANRSFLIQVNETPEYQEKALEHQRKDIAGLLDKSKEQQTQTILKAAQLHLEPLEVVIPFGDELRIPDYIFKKLRTNGHYLTLIKAIAFWNQKQREIMQKADGTRYIEATLEDVAWANKLSKEVLLRKSDELNGALRGFFESVKTWLKTNERENFYAKPLREKLRMNPMQVNRYLKELEQRGYLKQTGGNRKTGFEYSVTTWNDYEQLKSGMNILDETLEKLRKKYAK